MRAIVHFVKLQKHCRLRLTGLTKCTVTLTKVIIFLIKNENVNNALISDYAMCAYIATDWHWSCVGDIAMKKIKHFPSNIVRSIWLHLTWFNYYVVYCDVEGNNSDWQCHPHMLTCCYDTVYVRTNKIMSGHIVYISDFGRKIFNLILTNANT